ncbi:RNA-dependent RNA polymerase [Nowakowskiella sp. JEL0407]|nr:RNA-dependent RNA polymerase [Nowakowskiella sp. JEL0407]
MANSGIVTCKWVSCQLNIPLDKARDLLRDYLSKDATPVVYYSKVNHADNYTDCVIVDNSDMSSDLEMSGLESVQIHSIATSKNLPIFPTQITELPNTCKPIQNNQITIRERKSKRIVPAANTNTTNSSVPAGKPVVSATKEGDKVGDSKENDSAKKAEALNAFFKGKFGDSSAKKPAPQKSKISKKTSSSTSSSSSSKKNPFSLAPQPQKRKAIETNDDTIGLEVSSDESEEEIEDDLEDEMEIDPVNVVEKPKPNVVPAKAVEKPKDKAMVSKDTKMSVGSDTGPKKSEVKKNESEGELVFFASEGEDTDEDKQFADGGEGKRKAKMELEINFDDDEQMDEAEPVVTAEQHPQVSAVEGEVKEKRRVRRKRKVQKKVTTLNGKYMETRFEEAWESYSESETESIIPKEIVKSKPQEPVVAEKNVVNRKKSEVESSSESETEMQKKKRKREKKEDKKGAPQQKTLLSFFVYGQKYTCDGCKLDITKVVKISCVDCTDSQVDFCVDCFCSGVEPAESPHKRTHSYRVLEILNYPLFEKNWSADEEMMLIEGLELYGMGNWEQISEHIKTKEKLEVKRHYETVYCQSENWPVPMDIEPFDKETSRLGPDELVPVKKLFQKQKPVASAPSNHEISGFMPGRAEFETEYENDAETLIRELSFDQATDTQFDRDLKLTMLDIYNGVLDRREIRKKFILERELVEFKKIQAMEKKKSASEKELFQQARVFARMQTATDFDLFLDGLVSEMKIRHRISVLQEYRRMGITTYREAEEYEKEKRHRFGNGLKPHLSTTQTFATDKYRQSRLRPEETAIPQTPTQLPRVNSIPSTTSSPQPHPSPLPPRRPTAQPVDVSNADGYDLLLPSEQQICSTLRILPRAYLVIKETILKEYAARKGNLRKRQARGLVKIDVNKTSRLYDFWVGMGWIVPPGMLKEGSTKLYGWILLKNHVDAVNLLSGKPTINIGRHRLHFRIWRTEPECRLFELDNFSDTYEILDLSAGNWLGAESHDLWKFNPIATLKSTQPIRLRFRERPSALVVNVSPPNKGLYVLEIPYLNLVSGFNGRLSKVLHPRRAERDIFDLYITLEIAPTIYRSKSSIDEQAYNGLDGVRQDYIGKLVRNNTREIRAIDWTGEDFQALGLHRSNVYKFTIRTMETARLCRDLAQFNTQKRTAHHGKHRTILMNPHVREDAFIQFKAMLSYISSFPVCYHLEVMVSFRVFFPEEVICYPGLIEIIKNHVRDGDEQVVVDAIDMLFTQRGKSFNPTDPRHQRPITFLRQFLKRAKATKVLKKTTSVAPSNSPDFLTVYSATITPLSIFVEKPTVEQGNRVLRQYRHISDRFLRVNFAEEDGSRLLCKRDGYLNEIIEGRIKKYLKEGLLIAGRHYEFLAFSSSQLRDHGLWMFSPTEEISADDIRRWMGIFSHIRNPAKYAARMGMDRQCFTTTFATLEIPEMAIVNIPDIERGKYCFTDGIGKISRSLLEEVLKHYKAQWVTKELEAPSAYQIRFAGCKGMVAVDPTLEGNQLHVRPSMRKFEAPTSRTFEIVRSSRICRQGYLNRQLILLLSHLGIPDEIFQDLQSQYKSELNKLVLDKDVALRILLMGVAGGGHTVNMLINFLQSEAVESVGEPFLAGVLECTRLFCLNEMKERARFPVPDTFLLLGVVDETGTLEENEIFVQVSSICRTKSGQIIMSADRNGNQVYSRETKVMTGRCAVARSPALHPGDIQIVRAVRCEKLMHIKNCVVFSQKGHRPLPNKLAGGDLDGDEFFVSFHKPMIPRRGRLPMEFDLEKPIPLNRDVQMSDIFDFFGNYLVNDRLGQISNLHLACADFYDEGPSDMDCLELAELASIAVDFPKTGVPVVFKEKIMLDRYPHFMNNFIKQSYHSEKILGKLYDAVGDSQQGYNFLLHTRIPLKVPIEPTEEPIDPTQPPKFKTIYQRPFADQRFLVEGWQHFLPEAVKRATQYNGEIKDLMTRYQLETEIELVTGSVVGKFSKRRRGGGTGKSGSHEDSIDRSISGRRKFDVALVLRQAMEGIVAQSRRLFLGFSEEFSTRQVQIPGEDGIVVGESSSVKIDLEEIENLRRASAWYFAVYADEAQRRDFQYVFNEVEPVILEDEEEGGVLLSFAWTVGDVLTKCFEHSVLKQRELEKERVMDRNRVLNVK